MQFKFSKNVTFVCMFFIALMLWASYWQYTRYLSKTAYVVELMHRLAIPVTDAQSALASVNGRWEQLLHRRLRFTGEWDYSHEVALRNRLRDTTMGGFIITPLKFENAAILVSRGFVPLQLMSSEARKPFQETLTASFVGLVKETNRPKLFAPSDPPAGPGRPWLDQWLRVDIEAMQKQLPYPVAPVYVEMMPADVEVTQADLLESKSGRDEIFMPGSAAKLTSYNDLPEGTFPIPTYDSIVPAGRHYSYIFEWAIMAAMTALIGLVLQLKRPE